VDIALDQALHIAIQAHVDQFRRGSDVPYVVHPIQVAMALGRLGASSVVVQAGLLHDVVEDCEGWSSERLAGQFGGQVAALVAEVTENKDDSWADRKEHGIQSVATLSEGALLIKACDKLHNLSSLALSLESADDPSVVWARFRGRRDGTLDTSRRMVEALCQRVSAQLESCLRAALARTQKY